MSPSDPPSGGEHGSAPPGPGETGLERLDALGKLTDLDQRRLNQALGFDTLRLWMAVASAMLAAVVPPVVIAWFAISHAPLDWPRALVAAATLAFSGGLFTFASKISMRVSDSIELARCGKGDRDPKDLVDALRLIVDAIKEIVGRGKS